MRKALLIAGLTLSAPAAQAEASAITWSIAPDTGNQVQLTIESRWAPGSDSIWSNSRDISELPGLSMTQLRGQVQPARFTLAHDAGRLDCSGTIGRMTGSGSCALTPDAGFMSYLAAHGIARPDARGLFSLTMSGAGRDLIDAMEKLGYARPTIDQLTAMGIHGVSPEFIRGLATSGYRLQSADDLIAFRIHGVDLDYSRA